MPLGLLCAALSCRVVPQIQAKSDSVSAAVAGSAPTTTLPLTTVDAMLVSLQLLLTLCLTRAALSCRLVLQIQAKSDSAAATTTTVPLTTVDAMLDSLQLQRLFLLKIDTEGFDPLVLQGARRSLAEHKVDLVLFEYNSGGVWGLNGQTLKVNNCFCSSFTCFCFKEKIKDEKAAGPRCCFLSATAAACGARAGSN